MRRAMAVAVACAAMTVGTTARADTIRVKSTTDTVDAGLYNQDPIAPPENGGPLRDGYAAEHPEDTVSYSQVGTGRALTDARGGLADVVVTHAPSLERQFVLDGYSLGLGRQIFYSDYVIVGPKDDPAGVLDKHPHDAVGAYEDIAAAGAADPSKTRFQSRADDSGTNVQEHIIWGKTGDSVVKQQATTPLDGTDPTHQEPGSGGSFPAWYVRVKAGQADNLKNTQACVAAGNGCYTMVDRGTYNRNVNNGTITLLEIVSEKNAAGTRGGENLLVNPFSVYIVNPDADFPDGAPTPNVAAATRWADYIVSTSFQKTLESFPSAVDPAFLPDAFAKVALDSPPPAAVTAGSTVTFAGTVANRLPGAATLTGQPVQLQQSTNGGGTWSNVGMEVSSDMAGKFSVSAVVGQDTSYRLQLPGHAVTDYNALTGSTTDLGAVSATPVVSPTPTASPVPSASPAPTASPAVTAFPVDVVAPRVSRLKLTRKRLSLRVSEAATLRVRIARRGKTKASLRFSTSRARTVSVKHRKLEKGRYRISLSAEDDSGNIRTLRKTLRRR